MKSILCVKLNNKQLKKLERGIIDSTIPKSVYPDRVSLLPNCNGYALQKGEDLYIVTAGEFSRSGLVSRGYKEVDHPAYKKYLEQCSK
jgi:hypothetical protein